MAKIIGHGAPTSKTFGVLGQEYFDKDSNKVYTCTKVTHKTAYRAGEADAEYEWSVIGGGGAASWNDLQDKPFGVEPGTEFKESLLCNTPGLPYIGNLVILPLETYGYELNLVAGKTYKIVFKNGVTYTDVAKEKDNFVYIGTPSPTPEAPYYLGTSHKFEGVNFSFDGPGFLWDKSVSGNTRAEFTLYEEVEVEIITPIDYEFMPEGYPSVKTEIVEIVPEQSVTIIGEMTEITNVIHENYKTVTENSNLYLTVDGKEMKCNFAGIYHDMLGFMTENEKLAVVFRSSDEVIGLNNMSGEYDGKTVTVKVFTKQEIVKQLDPKFVGGSVIVSTEDDINFTCNYSASELIKMYVENPGRLATAKFVRRSDEYNLYVSYLTAVNCDANSDNIILMFNNMNINVTPNSVESVEDE